MPEEIKPRMQPAPNRIDTFLRLLIVLLAIAGIAVTGVAARADVAAGLF